MIRTVFTADADIAHLWVLLGALALAYLPMSTLLAAARTPRPAYRPRHIGRSRR